MEIKIEIFCETINEFYSHLSKLRSQIKKEARALKLNPLEDEFPEKVCLQDSNCYGEHYVTIRSEKLLESQRCKNNK